MNLITWPLGHLPRDVFRLHFLRVERNDTSMKKASTLFSKLELSLVSTIYLSSNPFFKIKLWFGISDVQNFATYPTAMFMRNARNEGIKIAITLMVPFNARANPATAHPLTQNDSSPKLS